MSAYIFYFFIHHTFFAVYFSKNAACEQNIDFKYCTIFHEYVCSQLVISYSNVGALFYSLFISFIIFTNQNKTSFSILILLFIDNCRMKNYYFHVLNYLKSP